MIVRNMLIAGQRMADQQRVGFIGVERAIGLIRNLERRQRDAAIEHQRLVRPKTHKEARRVLGLGIGNRIRRGGHGGVWCSGRFVLIIERLC
jgi:hypothetical protein